MKIHWDPGKYIGTLIFELKAILGLEGQKCAVLAKQSKIEEKFTKPK